MNIVLEVLATLANVVTVLEFALDRWREHRHEKRMTREVTKAQKGKRKGRRE